MDKKDLGKKIQQGRQKRGLTQEEVEQRLGFPSKSMTRIESGQRPPSTLELVQLSELFHIPIETFLNDKPFHEDPLVALYRMAPGLKRHTSIQSEVDRCIHLCEAGVSLERLLKQPTRQRALFTSLIPPSTPWEAIQQGEYVAKEERRRLGIGGLPIRDIVELLSSQGIWCAATQLPSEISGLFLYSPSIEMVILVNAKHVYSRQRFSYAHEYAHALFDADRRALVSEAANASELLEKRANAFAAAFLMPEEGMTELLYFLNKGLPSRSSLSVFDVSTQKAIEAEDRQLAKNQKLSPQDVAFLAYRFGVSYQAAVYRLHSLRFLSQEERESLLDAEDRGRDYEHLLHLEEVDQTDSLQRELRVYIVRLVVEAYRQEKISRGRVLELSTLLDLPPQDLLNLATEDD